MRPKKSRLPNSLARACASCSLGSFQEIPAMIAWSALFQRCEVDDQLVFDVRPLLAQPPPERVVVRIRRDLGDHAIHLRSVLLEMPRVLNRTAVGYGVG